MPQDLIAQAHQTVQKLQTLTIAFNDGVLRGTKLCAEFTAAICIPTTALVAYSKLFNPSLTDSPVVLLPFMAAIFSAGATAGAELLSAASTSLTGYIAGKNVKLGKTETEETHVHATTPASYKVGRAVAFAAALAGGVIFSDHVLFDNKTPQSVSSASAPSR